MQYDLEDLANELMDNLRANRRIMGFSPQELVSLAENQANHELMLEFAVQQLAFDVWEKGVKKYRRKHPRDFTGFLDLKEEHMELYRKRDVDVVREEYPSEMKNCRWHIHAHTSACRKTERKRGLKRRHSSGSQETLSS